MVNTCKICNSPFTKIYLVKEMMFGTREEFEYGICSVCGCLQLIKELENPGDYYNEDYYSLKGDPSLDYKGFLKGWLKKHRDYFIITGKGLLGKILEHLFPNPSVELFHFRKVIINKQSKILDVGSGIGITPYVFRNAGFKNIKGIDPFLERDIVYKNGLTIKKEPLFDVSENDWDMIMFNHSFEHLDNPERYLHKVNNLLKSGGICLIRIPTVSSYAWQHYKENWVQLDAPRHLFLHSIKSLEILASQTGFNFIQTAYESTDFQFIGSEQYQMGISLYTDDRSYYRGNTSLFSKGQLDAFKRETIEVNKNKLGDSIVAIFSKK